MSRAPVIIRGKAGGGRREVIEEATYLGSHISFQK